MTTTVDTRTMSDSSLAVGSPGPRTVTLDRSKETGGCELGFNGGELLAIGGCYSNDIFREAGKRGIAGINVQVTVRADSSGAPVRTHNVSSDVAIETDAAQEDILDLIQPRDRIAKTPKPLRLGTALKLAEFKAIPLR